MSEYNNIDKSYDPYTDFIVAPMNGTFDKLMYGFHSKFRMYLHHYNLIKFKYKRLALTWFLASFVAIGFFMVQDIKLPFHIFLGISLTNILAAVGITMLWFMELGIYDQLLKSIFEINIHIEQHYKHLSLSHNYMAVLCIRKSLDPVFFDGLFYILLLDTLFGISIIFLYLFLLIKSAFVANIIFSSLIILVVLSNYFLIKKTVSSSIKDNNSLKKMIFSSRFFKKSHSKRKKK